MRAWGYEVDAVFTSELYGDGFAQVLSIELSRPVEHICLDLQRDTIPFSGTQGRTLLKRFKASPRSSAGQAAVELLRSWLPQSVFESLTHLKLDEPTQGQGDEQAGGLS